MDRFDGIRGLSFEVERELMRALLWAFLNWPDCKVRQVTWTELAQWLPDSPETSEEALEFTTIRCSNEGFLRGLVREGGTFQIEGLTKLGKRMLRDEFALNERQAMLANPRGGYVGMIITLLALAIQLWLRSR